MRYYVWLFLLASLPALAQENKAPLMLEECYERARQNYPLIKQRDLITKARAYSVENAAKGYLPQLTFSGQATYQSDVVRFPSVAPGMSFPQLSKDQYKVQAEVSQTLYDGGNIKHQQEQSRADEAIQQQQLEVSLYAIRERVDQLFFGILLVDEQLKQNALQKADIQSGVDKMQGAVDNGAAFRSSLDELKAELLNADQARTELKATRKGFLLMLSLFINQPLDDSITLVRPPNVPLSPEIKRPELSLYNYQQRTYDIQEKQLRTGYLPKISAFAQGAYGRPTYNIIDNSFGFYGMAGVRFSWALSGLYTHRNSKQLLNINRKNLDIQQETFLFNTRITMAQQSADVQKYLDMIAQDNDIIALRSSVKKAANAQLENGVITSHDYINQVNAESLARQNLILHQIQLLQVQYNNKNTSGN